MKKFLKIELIIPLLYFLSVLPCFILNNFTFLSYGWIIPAIFGAYEDLKSSLISDSWSLSIGICGLFHAFIFSHIKYSLLSFILTGVFYLIIYFLFKKGFGAGDVIFSLALSLWLNPKYILFFLWISAFSSLIFIFLYFLICKKHFKKNIPFIPFLYIGGIITYYYGYEIYLIIETILL